MSNILKLLTFLADLFKKVSGIVAAQKVIDAKDQSLEEKDQRKIEKALGGEGGPSRTLWSGMFERIRKKKE